MKPRQGLLNGSVCSIVAVIAISFANSSAQAQSLPDLPPAVSPGGALPSLDGILPRRDKAPTVPSAPATTVPVPQSGVRMNVRGFVLDGIVEHPSSGISRQDLELRVEEMRVEHPTGFTLSDLQEVTDAITDIYRSNGYILARAFIPEQEVKDGHVVIKVMEGQLDQVSIQGNKSYSQESLMLPFKELINQPVNKDEIETALLELNDYPGLRFNSIFTPGKTQGTASLGINVESEKSWDGAVWFDNHGSAYTGEYRLWTDLFYNNPTGAADRISAQLLTTLEQDEGKNDYYALSYQRPIFGSRNVLGVELGSNNFNVGGDFAPLDLSGKSTTMGTSLRRSFMRTRKMNVEGRVALNMKESSTDLSTLNIGEDALTVLTLGGTVDYRDKWSGYTQAALHYSQGLAGVLGAMDEEGDGKSSRVGSSGERVGGDFSKINLNLAHLRPLTFDPVLFNQSVIIRAQMQFSDDLLVSMEQMSLGGPNSVRAYPPSERMVDSGQFVSVEWIAKAAQSVTEGRFFQDLQVSAFYDYGAGELNQAQANEVSSPKLQGIGASAQIMPQKQYMARLELAMPLGDPTPSNDRDIQYFFKFGYLF